MTEWSDIDATSTLLTASLNYFCTVINSVLFFVVINSLSYPMCPCILLYCKQKQCFCLLNPSHVISHMLVYICYSVFRFREISLFFLNVRKICKFLFDTFGTLKNA